MPDHTEQPMPIPNGRPSIQSLVRADLEDREQVGISRYGTALQANNGRDVLRDAYEEAMDLTCYLRQAIEERDAEAAPPTLPVWEQMTDRDKHEALWHVWKRETDGAEYAVENYPAMYRDHPLLVDLDEEEACDHAKTVIGTAKEAYDRLGVDEYARLMDLDPDVEG